MVPVQPAKPSRPGSRAGSVLVENEKRSCQEGEGLADRNDIRDQDLIMEDLEKMSQI